MSKLFNNVIGILPIPVFAMQLDVDTSDIHKFIIEDKNNRPNEGGNIASKKYQLLENECFSELKKAILNECEFYCSDVNKYRYDSIYISTSWYNVNPPGTTHHLHRHPNSIVSGVFYVKAPKNGGDLVFARETGMLLPVREELPTNVQSHDFCPVEPEDKLLVLFPSYLNHFVAENRSNEDRISIAFNVFFRGELGLGPTFTYLKV